MEMQNRQQLSYGLLRVSIQALGPDAVVSIASGEEIELFAAGRPARLAIQRLAVADSDPFALGMEARAPVAHDVDTAGYLTRSDVERDPSAIVGKLAGVHG